MTYVNPFIGGISNSAKTGNASFRNSWKTGVILPAGFKFTSAIPVNLRGEKVSEPLIIKTGKLVFDLHA